MDLDLFREYGHRFVDWIAGFYENIESYPVLSQVKPGDIKNQLPTTPPGEGEGIEYIFEDFKRIILPGITHWQHPSFFAYFPANTSIPSLLAEMLTAALGAQCMVWQTSPAGTELEEVVMEWVRRMLGLPEGFSGVIQDTASTATLCALLCARERSTDFSINSGGFTGEGKGHRLAVYTSEQAHSSIEKGAKIAGFGREYVRLIPVDERMQLLPKELENAMSKDRAEGITPCCVVAACGTTSSMAIDPLRPIGEICNKEGIWLHVDAAMAGSAAILPEARHILDGVELADSFVFNPHKWLFTNFDCSAYFCRDPRQLVKTFSITPEYLKTDVDMKVKNFRDWGIPLGRRFRALKLWFVIRSMGVKGIQERLRAHIRLAEEFAGWIEEDERFELVVPVSLNLVCFRYNPKGKNLPEEKLEGLNNALLNNLNRSGKLFLTHTKLGGKYTLRLCIGQTNTERRHVEDAWNMIQTSRLVS
ncbi:MAG: amino acid decarboxylase [Spirochaetes bacterium DG_61]|jgi:aromatic-L-amino-acid decarboxylase|nr:MAG: amino acid decarboxylase [Spirochaetes bacterium DG_61]